MHQRGSKQFTHPVFPSPAAARMERAAAWTFPRASHPADQEPDDERRGGDRPSSTDLELLAQHHIRLILQFGSSLVACDLASHVRLQQRGYGGDVTAPSPMEQSPSRGRPDDPQLVVRRSGGAHRARRAGPRSRKATAGSLASRAGQTVSKRRRGRMVGVADAAEVLPERTPRCSAPPAGPQTAWGLGGMGAGKLAPVAAGPAPGRDGVSAWLAADQPLEPAVAPAPDPDTDHDPRSLPQLRRVSAAGSG